MPFTVQSLQDSHGISLTCSRSESIDAYNKTLLKFLNLTDWTGLLYNSHLFLFAFHMLCRRFISEPVIQNTKIQNSEKKFQGDGDGLIAEALRHDEYFFMGHIYIATNLIRGMDVTSKNDERIEEIIDTLNTLKSKIKKLRPNELLYFQALKFLFIGSTKKALECWKCIVELNSFDILALLYLHYGWMGIGQTENVLKSISCVIQDFEKSKPETLPYIYGLYGMALEETYQYKKSWKYIHLSLNINPYIVTSSHAKVHVLQELGHNYGCIKFLENNEKYWRNNLKMHHVEWHWMLSYVDLGKYRQGLQLFDESYLNGNKQKIKNDVRLRDAASFLWRLELNEYDFDHDLEIKDEIKYRWSLLRQFIKPELNERFIQIYHDSYYLMNLIKNDQELAAKYVKILKKKSNECVENKSDNTYLVETCPNAAISVFEGLYDGFVCNEYDKGFNKMYNALVTDNNEWRFGGSRAQKDIFPLTMIHLGFKAGKYEKVKCLLNERLAMKHIACTNTLNSMSRLYANSHYNDRETANIYKNARLKIIDQQYRDVNDGSLDQWNTFCGYDTSKL